MFGRTTETVEAPALTADTLDTWSEALRVIDAFQVARSRAFNEGRSLTDADISGVLDGVLRSRPHMRDAVTRILQAGR